MGRARTMVQNAPKNWPRRQILRPFRDHFLVRTHNTKSNVSLSESHKHDTNNPHACSSPSPGTLRKSQNIKSCANICVRRGSGGRYCAIKVRRRCGAFGPTHVLHCFLRDLGRRPPPETIFEQFQYYFVWFSFFRYNTIFFFALSWRCNYNSRHEPATNKKLSRRAMPTSLNIQSIEQAYQKSV